MATATKKQSQNDESFLSYRNFEVRASTIDAEERSIEVLLTTETPVPMMDWERYEMVPEVLLTSGAIIPGNRQVPLLDSHARWSTTTQLGSIRKLSKTTEGVVGRAVFSTVAESEWTKVREGHVTDVSAGYQVLERTYIAKGTKQIVSGREFSGPVSVVTKWRLREGSITPIGADDQAKMRGLAHLPAPKTQEQTKMNEHVRAILVAQGMPADFSDDAATRWAEENAGKIAERKPADPPPAINVEKIVEEATRKASEAAAAALAAAEKKRADFRKEIDSLCELADLPEEKSRCYELESIEKVREHIQEAKKNRSVTIGGMPRLADNQPADRYREVLGTALVMRALENTACGKESIDKVFPAEKRAKDAERFRHAGMLEIARECLHADGFDTRGLTREQIAIAALGWPEKAGLRTGSFGYHTTGSFPKITQDAVNKSMMIGYVETPSTWEGPMRRGSSVPDFKTIHRIRLGAVPNLPVWPDNTNPEQVSFGDAEETYAVEARSAEFSLSWRLMVNDDMDAISRIPQMFGASARRTINTAAWAQITSNPTMSDSVALFAAATGARKRTNLTTGAGAPSVATRQTLTNLMRQMRGENTPEGNESSDILSLEPRYIIGPSALETDILQLVNSPADPSKSNSMTYNPARTLMPVIEPLLDASSTTAWYLFASPSQIDTVEVTFLQGQEQPVTRDWIDERSLAHCWAVLQTFAAKALNHRGMQKHAGA